MSIFVQGVCVGRKDETFEYTDKNGKPAEFRSIGVSFAEPDGNGDPISVEVDEKQLGQFRPFQQYKIAVEARAMQTKRGIFCRIAMLKNAIAEHMGNGVTPSRPAEAK